MDSVSHKMPYKGFKVAGFGTDDSLLDVAYRVLDDGTILATRYNSITGKAEKGAFTYNHNR